MPDVPADVPLAEATSPGLRLVPFDDAEPDADELGVLDGDVLPDADADPEVVGLAVFVTVDVGVAVGQDVPGAVVVFLLSGALTLADAEAVAEVLALGGAVPVPVPVAVAVAVVLALSPGLTLLAGVPLSPLLVLPVGGLVGGLAGVTVGVTDLLGVALTGGEELGGHAGTVGLLGPMVLAPWLRVPCDAPCWVAVPAELEGSVVLCEEVIPTAELSW